MSVARLDRASLLEQVGDARTNIENKRKGIEGSLSPLIETNSDSSRYLFGEQGPLQMFLEILSTEVKNLDRITELLEGAVDLTAEMEAEALEVIQRAEGQIKGFTLQQLEKTQRAIEHFNQNAEGG